MHSCSLCKNRISVFECNITKTLICNYCCDKFQLNQWTEGWERYFDDTSQKYEHLSEDYLKLHSKCLSCSGLCRYEGYEVFKEPERGFGFSLFSFNHNGKYVFTDNPDQIYPKRKALLENMDRMTLEDYYYLAETYHFLRDYSNSINLLTEAVGKFENYELYRLLGKSYHHSGNKKEALNNFKKSLFLCETSAETNRYIADLLRSIKDYEGSIYYYKQALELLDFDEEGIINDSFHEYNHFGLAIAYSKINQYENAIEVANKFLSVSGIVWRDFKERVESIRSGKVHDYNAESDIHTTSTLYEILSIAYIELDELNAAEDYINRAKWLNPNDIDIARIEGIVIGRLSSQQKLQEYKDLIETLKMNAEIKLFAPIEKLTDSVEEIKKNVEGLNKESKTDLLELKPNFMGLGLNINEVIKKLSKKK